MKMSNNQKMSFQSGLVINGKNLNRLQKWFFNKSHRYIENIFVGIPVGISMIFYIAQVLYLSYQGEIANIIYLTISILSLWYMYAYVLNKYIFIIEVSSSVDYYKEIEKLTKPYLTSHEDVVQIYKNILRYAKSSRMDSAMVKAINNSSGHKVFDEIRRLISMYLPAIMGYMEELRFEDIKEAIKRAKDIREDFKLHKEYDFGKEEIKDLRDLYALLKEIKITDDFRKKVIESKTKEEIVVFIKAKLTVS